MHAGIIFRIADKKIAFCFERMRFLRAMFNKPIIMKKLFLTLSLVATLTFTSCDNDNAVNPQPLGKATITGTVYADFDYTNNDDEKTWDVVANKKMIVEISQYNPETETITSTRFIETTTDANGNYSIEVPVGNISLEVSMKLVDFRADVKTSEGTESVIFYGNWFNSGADVEKGGEYIRDIYYND